MARLGSRWKVVGERGRSALRRRFGLDAGRFRPAKRHRAGNDWVPVGLCPFGLDRVRRADDVSVERLIHIDDPERFRRTVQTYRSVDDTCSGVLSPDERVRLLVRSAACGTPVIVTRPQDYEDLVPPAVVAALQGVTPSDLHDVSRAELIAFRQMSAVFDHLVLGPAWRSTGTPAVSITVATHRPHFLNRWTRQIAAQTHERIQVVAALRADRFSSTDRDALRRVLEAAGVDVVVVEVPAGASLGAALESARLRADGDVILKWDDDDLYGSHHVADLLRARHVTGAPLVGKACDLVYLASRDVTVVRHQADRECYSPTLSGNTLMIERQALDAVGGWPDVSLGEDADLIARVQRAGGLTYRATGFGMIAVRHADPVAHTWNLDEDALVQRAVRTWPGLELELTGVDVAPDISAEVRRSAAGGR